MRVQSLKVKNFRNIVDSSLVLNPQINVLLGANGQGKTSFLEALGFLSSLRSFRNIKTSSVIRKGSLDSYAECILTSNINTHHRNVNDWQTSLKIALHQTMPSKTPVATKTAYVNHKLIRSTTQYLSQRFGSFQLGFHAITFNPSDHDLISGDPSIRRSYLNRVLAAEDIQYLIILKKYQKLLEERNAILKTPGVFSNALLTGYTGLYCEYGAWLTLRRLQWIQRLKTSLQTVMSEIAPSQSSLQLVYASQWAPLVQQISINNKELSYDYFTGHGELPSLKLLEHSFQEKLMQFSFAEKKCGYSLIGPHRDDWIFYMGRDPLKEYGSQGEARSALLALKLAELELFRNETGHRPIFLLDDFSSELDRERRLFLMQFLKKTDLQTFITTTDFAGLSELKNSNISSFLVQNGAIVEERFSLLSS